MIVNIIKQLVSWFHFDKNTLKNGLHYLINALFMGSTLMFIYKTVSDALPYFQKNCANDPLYSCDVGDFSAAMYTMLKEKFTESFYDGMFQATFTYSFVGALNAIEAHIRHVFRDYEGTNVIGWNILVKDVKTGKYRLEIPSEDTCSMKDLMQDDEVLQDKVNTAMSAEKSKGGKYPDFFILMDSPDDHIEFMRRIMNRVSQSIKSSQWPNYAMSRLETVEEREEDPLVLAVAEKNDGMRAYMMRTWLVFPSVLRTLMQYSEEELTDPHGPFIVSREHHRIRLRNLRLWAIAEFDGVGLDKTFMGTPVFLPRVPQQFHTIAYSPDNSSTIDVASGGRSPATPSRRSSRLAGRSS